MYKNFNKLYQLKSYDEQLKMLWQWIKQNHINFSEFKELLTSISTMRAKEE